MALSGKCAEQGLILGPMAEQQLRRIAQGDVTTLVQSSVAAGLLLLAALALIVPIILRARQGRGSGTDGRDED
jgi:putative tricarboxylic transport membrane protein